MKVDYLPGGVGIYEESGGKSCAAFFIEKTTTGVGVSDARNHSVSDTLIGRFEIIEE